MSKGWYVPEARKATMEKWGRKDLYASFRSIQHLPYGEGIAIAEKFQAFDPEKINDEAMAAMFQQLVDLIIDWKMEHPQEGGELAKPEKAEDLYVLPMEVLLFMMETALQDMDEAVPLEKETRREPSPQA